MKNQYLYIIKSYGKDKIYYKLGYTSDIIKRMYQYKHANPGIELLHLYITHNAFNIEQNFHKNNKAVSGNEWYSEEYYNLMINFIKQYKVINTTLVDIIKEKIALNMTFQQIVEECEKGDEDYLKWAYSKYDFLEIAINHLGFEKIKELKYIPKIIKRYCMKYAHLNENEKINSLVKDKFKVGVFYDLVFIKEELQKIYNDLNINKTAKASDIKSYKTLKTTKKMIKGETTNGYIMLN